MRLIARKERPYHGAQLRFTGVEGLRLRCFATNTKDGQLTDLLAWMPMLALTGDRLGRLRAVVGTSVSTR